MYSSSEKRTKLLLNLIPISAFVFILFVSITLLRNTTKTPQTPHLHIQNHLQIAHATCEGTLYRDLCISTLSSLPDLTSKSLPQLIAATVNQTMYEIRASSRNYTRIETKTHLDILEHRALDDCLELLSYTMEDLKSTLSELSTRKTVSQKNHHELQTIFSAAMTNQYTCLDGFAYSRGHVREIIKRGIYNISHHVSNSLVMLNKIPGDNKTSPSEAFPGYGRVKNGFPNWLKQKDRKLLQAAGNETKFDLIVAKDGTGNFTTISEAVAAAPNNSQTRFVIYIKAGAYWETVEVERKKKYLMFVGDGIGKTVVKASRNVVDGWTTFRSATVAVVGNGFIAKGITIENAAGPSKLQAVALRCGSDLSAFYRCSFVGYQDTLYVHSLRQFYRECDIYGTVDFIFGNAAAVFQNCSLYARKPDPNQKNIFTAQGREDRNQNTGISIMNSKLVAAADLIPEKSSFKTFLGRPWKEYSRTVILHSFIDDSVDPAGWFEWNDTFALSTLYYGEYMNRGPGSNTSARVTWHGFRVINNSAEASQFAAGPFIQGQEWLHSTNIPYSLDLTS